MRGLLNVQSGTSMAYLLIGGFVAPPIQFILYSHGNRLGSNPGKNRDPRRGVSCVVEVPGRRLILWEGIG